MKDLMVYGGIVVNKLYCGSMEGIVMAGSELREVRSFRPEKLR